MPITRREFLSAVGVAVASLLTSRCRPTCYVPVLTPSTLTAQGGDWDRLRQYWWDLDLLARDAQNLEKGQQTLQKFTAGHRAALDALVAAGQVSPEVADDLQLAFEGAAYHVWRANAPITCYVPAPYPDYGTQSNVDLAKQAESLEEMAQKGALDPDTVARARAAIERDIAWRTLPEGDQKAIIEAVMEAAQGTDQYPPLEKLDLEISTSAREAARILVELLLKQR